MLQEHHDLARAFPDVGLTHGETLGLALREAIGLLLDEAFGDVLGLAVGLFLFWLHLMGVVMALSEVVSLLCGGEFV